VIDTADRDKVPKLLVKLKGVKEIKELEYHFL